MFQPINPPSLLAKNSTPGLANRDPTYLQKWRRAMARVRSGVSGVRAKILFVGDSTTAGLGAGSGGSGTTGARQNSRVDLLAAMLNRNSVPAQADSMLGFTGGTSDTGFDARVVYGSGWSGSQDSFAGGLLTNSSTTSAVTFTPANAFDSIDVWYVDSSAGVAVSVDSGSTLATVCTGGTSNYLKQTITGITLGTHTVKLAKTAASGASYIGAVMCYASTVPRVELYNGGSSGWQTSNWINNSNSWDPLKVIGQYAPDLTVIDIGINDANTGNVAVAAYISNVQTIINEALLSGDVILCVPIPITAPLFGSYVPALYQLATQNNLPLVDFNYRFVSRAQATTLGLNFDTLHFNATGYADVAQGLYQVLAAA